MQNFPHWYRRLTARLDRFLNRGLPPERRVTLRLRWPLYLWPLFLFCQIVTPHPVWTMLLVALPILYGIAYFWVREQAQTVDVTRQRQGTILVAGDSFTEELTLHNRGRLPVLWAEFVDGSDLPGYQPSRIVAAPAASFYRWKTEVICQRRGVYQLGPFHLRLADPFGFFSVRIDFHKVDALLIYPRVAKLPDMALPRGNASGSDQRRRSLQGVQPAASVRAYQRGDSLRHIHWPMTAHRGDLTVKELELEPSGDVWIVLDLNGAAHSGHGAASTFEYAIVAAASLAAALLESGDQRAVGLLAVSGQPTDSVGPDNLVLQELAQANDTLLLPPQAGRAQLWQLLAALAPVEPSDVSLAQLLRQSGPVLGRRRSVVVITPFADGPATSSAEQDWAAELLRLRAAGLHASVLLVLPQASPPAASDPLRAVLAGLDVPLNSLSVDTTLPPLITYRRTRTVARSTPTGGVVVREIEEEVG